MAAKRECGGCTLCCKIMSVSDFPAKPNDQWCAHCRIGKGCAIYADRPDACVTFRCGWLQADPSDAGSIRMFPEHLRPDRCGVVFDSTSNGMGLVAHCDPKTPLRWRQGDVLRLLRAAARLGLHASARAGNRFWAIGAHGEWEATPDSLTPQTDDPTGPIDIVVPYEIAKKIGFGRQA